MTTTEHVDPATRWDKAKTAFYLLIVPVILVTLWTISMLNGHSW